mmetsp:Transcript_22688/g.34025  ORF Transcript_22688/g.34025 Transcript_22688/m.34025 type:complete len:341 (-) Transcript_22688:206-1228(-)
MMMRRKLKSEADEPLTVEEGHSRATTIRTKLDPHRVRPILSKLSLLVIGYIIGRYNSGVIEPCSSVDQPDEQQLAQAAAPASIVVTHEEEKDVVEFKMNSMQMMDWEIPTDVLYQRYEECKDDRKTAFTGGFCLIKRRLLGDNWMVDKSLAVYLRDNLFNGMSVVDLGAGLGNYGKIFNEEGSPVKSWVGFDGAMNIQGATNGLVRYMDLTQPHPADERPCVKGDWVLSLEVAEHILPQFIDHYIRNLRCSCTVGAVVSWAPPVKEGSIGDALGHVNRLEEKDAIAAMARWGFVVDGEATLAVRDAAGAENFVKNTVVYRVKKKTVKKEYQKEKKVGYFS